MMSIIKISHIAEFILTNREDISHMVAHEKVVCLDHDKVIMQCRCIEGHHNIKRIVCPFVDSAHTERKPEPGSLAAKLGHLDHTIVFIKNAIAELEAAAITPHSNAKELVMLHMMIPMLEHDQAQRSAVIDDMKAAAKELTGDPR